MNPFARLGLGAAAALVVVGLSYHRGYDHAWAKGEAQAETLRAEMLEASAEHQKKEAAIALNLERSERQRERDRLDAEKLINALRARKPEVVYVQTSASEHPCVDSSGMLSDAASANRAIAAALPPAEREPYEQAAAGADAGNGATCYAQLLNYVQLMTVLLSEAVLTAHGLQDYVRDIEQAGLVGLGTEEGDGDD